MAGDSISHRIIRMIAVLLIVSFLVGMRSLSSLAASIITYLPIVVRGWLPDPTFLSPILITEVYYDPPDPEPELEWYEIYNRGPYLINLTRYKIGDGESKGDHESMYIFPDDATILPGQVVVIATRAANFTAVFGSLPDYEIIPSDPAVPNMSKYRKWATGNTNLGNGGDEVILLDEEDIIIDAVSWENSTFAFDPSVEGVSEGSSISRKPANLDHNSALDWIEPNSPSPGTVDLIPSTATPTWTGTPTQTSTPTPTNTPLPCEQTDLTISEVLYDPIGSDDPDPEWIEIFNASELSVNLACVKVGDEETKAGGEGMYRFPEGALLAPDGVSVIAQQASTFLSDYGFRPDFEISNSDSQVPDMIRYVDWAGGSVNLSNTGDEVLLLDTDDLIIDAVSWGSSNFAFVPPVSLVEESHSIERVPANFDSNSASDWQDQSTPSPGQVTLNLPTSTSTLSPTPTNTPTKQGITASPTLSPTSTNTPIPCGSAELLISEALYNPAGVDDPDGEWIEILNPSTGLVYLGCIKVGDEETLGGGEGMYRFPDDRYIASGEVILLANQASIFLSQYGFFPDFELIETDPQVPNLIKYSAWANGSINLSNGGDDVLLLNGEDQILDAVSWDASEFAFDPPVDPVDEGHSIERRPADHDSNTSLDWFDQSNPAPGQVDLSMPTPTQTPTVQTTISTSTPTPSRTPTPTRTSTLTRTPTPSPTSTQPNSGNWVINEIHSDPDSALGDANGDGDVSVVEDEFVEIVNSSISTVDVSGWKIYDGGSLRHTFPAGSFVASGCSVLVFGGGSSVGNFGNSLVQISSTGNLGLNDRIDIVTLFNLDGVAEASVSYGVEAGDNQSITRDPDIYGLEPLVKHSLANGSNGALFSPGTMVDGSFFSGCP